MKIQVIRIGRDGRRHRGEPGARRTPSDGVEPFARAGRSWSRKARMRRQPQDALQGEVLVSMLASDAALRAAVGLDDALLDGAAPGSSIATWRRCRWRWRGS